MPLDARVSSDGTMMVQHKESTVKKCLAGRSGHEAQAILSGQDCACEPLVGFVTANGHG